MTPRPTSSPAQRRASQPSRSCCASRPVTTSPTRSWSSMRSTRDGTAVVPPPGGGGRRGQRGHGRRALRRRRRRAPSWCRSPSLRAGPAARVRYLAVNELGPRVWQIASQVVVGPSATPRRCSATVALGGDYARVRTDGRLVGRGATGDQLAVVLRRGDQMLDFRTFQDHAAPRDHQSTCCSRARSRVTPAASTPASSGSGRRRRGTNAFQTNRNIKLSRRGVGRVRAQPRDREQRRALQPRLGRRADRRGAALLPREPGRAARRSPSGSSCSGSSTRCSTGCRRRTLVPGAAPGQVVGQARPAGRAHDRATTVRVGPLDDLAPGTARRVEVDGRADRRRAHRRRRLRHRRHVQPRQHLAVARARCSATSGRSSAGSTAARSRSRPASPSRCRRPSRCRSTTPGSTTATIVVVVP